MVPPFDALHQRYILSPPELRAVISQCKDALSHATAHGRLTGPLPVRWRIGWKYHWRLLRRDRDGSALVEITIDSPEKARFYWRQIRLVPQERLPYSSRPE
jgi:hypothetical protein